MEDVGKISSRFMLEHGINKIKILIPLTKLIKNQSHREPTFKFLNPPTNSTPFDVVNLQDENTTIIFSPK